MITSQGVKRALRARQKQSSQSLAFRLEDFLFPEQLAFVLDRSPNKIAMCSRRAGKTISCAADLIKTALDHPGTVSLYITLSRNNAKKIIWKELKNINKNYKLQLVFNESELSATTSQGSVIYLSGAKDLNEIEKFRGLALIKVYIDEAQSFRSYIKELVDEALGPTLLDHAGTICLIGTPPPVANGYFMDTFTKGNTSWSKHAWTFFNNPFLVKKSKLTHDALLQRELDRRGVTREDPGIQREFFGRCVVDTNSLLIHYNNHINDYDFMPKVAPNGQPIKYQYILGIDLGFNDADAIALLAWSENSPNVWLVEETLTTKQDVTDLAAKIKQYQMRYDINKLVIDAGALGKKITEELIKRHQIPLEAADKSRKMENIAFLNDALRTGVFKAKSNSRFAIDSFLVEIDRDKSTPEKIKVSDRYHSDIIDAVLYAFKLAYAYTYTEPTQTPQWGTKEWVDSQHDVMWEQAKEHFGNLQTSTNYWDNVGE